MIDKAKAAAMFWTIEHLSITKFQLFSELTIDDPALPVPNYISYTILFLEGVASPPNTITAVQIKFVPDGQPLKPPNWQPPNLACEKHQSEYAGMMDMVTRGIENKKPGSDFTATYIIEIGQLDIILSN